MRLTKAVKRAKAAASRKKSGIAKAVRGLLTKTNPGAKLAGAKIERLKGGVIKVTPIKANSGGSVYTVEHSGGRWGNFSTKAQAMAYAKRMRAANKQAGNRSPVRVVKVK